MPKGSPFGQGAYDDETARLYGLVPTDPEAHGPSRVPYGPDEGLFLKAENHPTFYKSVITDLMWGGRIWRNKKTGRVYSFEADREPGEEFEEQEYVHPGPMGYLVPRKKGVRGNAVDKAFGDND